MAAGSYQSRSQGVLLPHDQEDLHAQEESSSQKIQSRGRPLCQDQAAAWQGEFSKT